MKKSLVALAALAAIGAASAQSTVTLYGVVDTNITYDKGASSLTSVGTGGLNGSRFGMRGAEDLGGGLSAIFQIEAGFNSDTGASAQGSTAAGGTASRLFGRTAAVGLQGGFGSVRIGRMYTPIGLLLDETATMGTKPADTVATAGMLSNAAYRTDNALTYASPNFGGLTFQAQYSLNADGAEVAARTGRHHGFNVMYKGGPLYAGLGYLDLRTNTPAAGDDAKAVLAQLGYNFGFATIRGQFETNDTGLAEDRKYLGLEASVPFGAFTASLGIARVKDSTGAAGVSDDVDLISLQGVYNLSKRTALYSMFTNVSNDAATRVGFNTPNLDQNSRRFQLGVRHSF
jgi:predicted porin